MANIWALNGVLKLPFALPLCQGIGMASSSPEINKVEMDITRFTIKRISVCFNSRRSLAVQDASSSLHPIFPFTYFSRRGGRDSLWFLETLGRFHSVSSL